MLSSAARPCSVRDGAAAVGLGLGWVVIGFAGCVNSRRANLTT